MAYWRELASVVNPLSDDQRFLRPSLLPGLLSAASRAWQRSEGALRLFEIGHVFRPIDPKADGAPSRSGDGMHADNGVIEWPSLCGLACFESDDESSAIDRRLLEVKGEVEWLVASLAGTTGETVPRARAYLHPAASADLTIGGTTVAKFGRIHPRLSNAFDLPPSTYTFMLYMEELPHERPVRPFAPLPRYPGTRRDIAVIVSEDVTAGDLMRAVRAAGANAFEDVAAFDEYVGPQVERGRKSVALRVMLRRADTTITDSEADASIETIVAALRREFGAELRGPSR